MLTISTLTTDAMLDALLDQLDAGFLRVYSGSRPAGPGTALASENVLLVQFTFGDPAFDAAADKMKAATAIADATAAATGKATFFRAVLDDGTTAVVDGSVGGNGADMFIVNPMIVTGLPVPCARFVISLGDRG